MLSRRSVRRPSEVAAFLTCLLMLLLAGSVASAGVPGDAGSIDHVNSRNGELRLLYSVPGLSAEAAPDLASVEVTIDGATVPARAELANDSDEKVRRTAILAIDVSNSMQGEKFEEAKAAAKVFLETVPPDVYVGIVAFARDAQTVQAPSLDRAAAAAVIDDLALSPTTRLYEGVRLAVEAAGTAGQRNVLVLSDGRDTSATPLEDVTKLIRDAKTKVDVVALASAPGARAPLEAMARAGEGAVLAADEPAALSQAFSAEAEVLAKQVLITAEVPADALGSEGSVAVGIGAGSATYTDTAFVSLGAAEKRPTTTPSEPREIPPPRFVVSHTTMLAGLVVAALGTLIVLLFALGVFNKRRTETLADRIAAYTRTGDARSAAGTPGVRLAEPKPEGVAKNALGIAEKALSGNKGLEATLAARLDGAGMSLKPAEWLLLHAGIAVGAGLVGLLLSSGGVLMTGILLALGLLGPWFFLSFKRSRRLKAFNSQLADTLQLMSGSLSAGLSFAQSVDTVVREGNDPMAGELRRALVEARLGVEMEDALDSVSSRMDSQDFHWVVMAVRIQREVGGNLAELLLKVAETLREREYLRRHVSALSAEGRLSAWILGGLPPAFILYLAVSRPDYLKPMVTTTLGWIMCGAIAFLTVSGGLWMKKLVKVEV